MMVRSGDIIASYDFTLFWQVTGSYSAFMIDIFSDKIIEEKFLGTEPQCDAEEVNIYNHMFLVHDFQQKDNAWVRLVPESLHSQPFRTKEEKALVKALFL